MSCTVCAAGNWKMHGDDAALATIDAIGAAARELSAILSVIFPPVTLFYRARVRGVRLGGQDCHVETKGAHTGDIAAEMPADAGIPILCGGSVKPGKATEILAPADVDGGRAGGASLSPPDFIPIMRALAARKGHRT